MEHIFFEPNPPPSKMQDKDEAPFSFGGDDSSSREMPDSDTIHAFTQMISSISKSCFQTCLPDSKAIVSKLSSSDENCVALCTARYLDMKILMAKRLMEKQQLQ